MTGTRTSRRTIAAATAAVILLAVGGVAYRALAAYLGFSDREPLGPISLPMNAGTWEGKDVAIDERIGDLIKRDWDAFLNRAYGRGGEQVTLYMAYGTNLWKLIRHKVDTCYILGGWTLERSRTQELEAPDGGKVRCRMYRFLKGTTALTVLNYYIADGQYHPDTGFWRRQVLPRSFRYIANVQVVCSSDVRNAPELPEASVRAFVLDSAAAIRAAMPDAPPPPQIAAGRPPSETAKPARARGE